MQRLKILYIGSNDSKSTAYHRSQALVRLGHFVDLINPNESLTKGKFSGLINAFHYRTGFVFIQFNILKWLRQEVPSRNNYELIWVDGGELLGKQCIKYLNSFNIPVVLYNLDDPTGKRDGRRFVSLKSGIPLYSLCLVCRPINVGEYIALGAKKVLFVYRSYDEVEHAPINSFELIDNQFKSDIVFVGTYIKGERRDEFLLKLIQAGLKITVWGNRWDKSPIYDQIKEIIKGRPLFGREYVSAIQGSKISLGFLSSGNRDLHTQRSLEIPFMGGLFCAERTSEHLELFEEGKEAVFWSSPEECIEVCKELLKNEEKIGLIKAAGRKKVIDLKLGNEEMCKRALKELNLL